MTGILSKISDDLTNGDTTSSMGGIQDGDWLWVWLQMRSRQLRKQSY